MHWTSLTGSTAAFGTTWTWTGGNGVKSYTNIQLNQGLNKVLSTIKTIPVSLYFFHIATFRSPSSQSTAKWTNTASGSIVADVAYDLFTSATPGGSNAYEIMIWLANYNAGPISSAYGATGAPTPVASNLSLGGYTWNLYYGSNGYNYVYSFLPVSGTIPSFSADINLFLKVREHFTVCSRHDLTGSTVPDYQPVTSGVAVPYHPPVRHGGNFRKRYAECLGVHRGHQLEYAKPCTYQTSPCMRLNNFDHREPCRPHHL
jgi:hypothetical protein